MGYFLSEPLYSKMLTGPSDPLITNIGYQNFHYTAPQQHQWMQNYYTLHFVLSGSGNLKMHGCHHKIQKHQIFIIPPHEPMMYFPNPQDPWEYCWFCINGKKAAVLFEDLGVTVDSPVLPINCGVQIEALLTGLFSSPAEISHYRAIATFYTILDLITQPALVQPDQIKPLIDLNFQESTFTIEALCHTCGLSHPQLCRVFFKRYGMTAKQYLIYKRMEYAKSLLRETDLKNEAVALSCGYRDAAHFMKEFKRHVGIPAGKYRALHQKSN